MNAFDALAIAALVAGFILGFAQGAVRRVLGIGAILLSVMLAANLAIPGGDWLAGYWTQYTPAYNRLLAFAGLVILFVFLSTLAIQIAYHRVLVFSRVEIADELLGALLGVLQAALVIGACVVVLDSYFRIESQYFATDVRAIRDFWTTMDLSTTADVYRHTLLPGFFTLLGGLFPADLGRIFAS